ncbi:hypothetical protein [Candidatus Spongiihabitans sp.]|uniref:hypothetical protein n=1 Tax=Candidatus Spongiihabitans sp. TaxID=3101308 RepID=UPI003C79AFDF
MQIWEKLMIGVFALIIIFWFFPGIKATLEKSRQAPKDWGGALIPIGLVVLFILFLVSTL